MTSAVDTPAPKEWRGRFFEDLQPGDVFRSRLGRTISEADNTWFTCLTMNTNQVHFNEPFASGTRFGRLLVNSTLTLALVTGLSVGDISENATANLSWTDVLLPNPVYVGDTIWSESEILAARPSASRPSVGLVTARTRGVNQRAEVIAEFKRTFMVYRRRAPEVTDGFPVTADAWRVQR
ncbi:MAG TPA: MaoC family dehydratase [Solirubrobacter sp.]|nr:MaoC family dehydratase [Solirubrobacter sp.]